MRRAESACLPGACLPGACLLGAWLPGASLPRASLPGAGLGYSAWETLDMLKSGTRRAGVAVREK